MAARTVRAPGGRTWRVRRRWTRRRLRWRGRAGREGWDLLDLTDAIELGPLAVIGIIAAVLLAVFFVIPLLVAALELLLLVVLLALGVVAKIVFRRPWEVDAETVGPPPDHRRWAVVGWAASGRAVDHVAQSLEAGLTDVGPPP